MSTPSPSIPPIRNNLWFIEKHSNSKNFSNSLNFNCPQYLAGVLQIGGGCLYVSCPTCLRLGYDGGL